MLNNLHMILSVSTTEWVQKIDSDSEINELGEIIEADPVKFSFETPGWYFLAIIFIIVLLLIMLKLIRNYRSNAYRRQALKKLEQLDTHHAENSEEIHLTRVLTVLKWVAIQAYGRKKVATLHGKSWLKFLDSKIDANPFIQYELLIKKSIYQCLPMKSDEFKNFNTISKIWIRKHA